MPDIPPLYRQVLGVIDVTTVATCALVNDIGSDGPIDLLATLAPYFPAEVSQAAQIMLEAIVKYEQEDGSGKLFSVVKRAIEVILPPLKVLKSVFPLSLS